MTAPLASCNHQTSNIPPSSSPSSSSSSSSAFCSTPFSSPAGPENRVSICSRMSLSLKSLGEHAESPTLASHASAYSSHSPSSALTPTPRDGNSSTTSMSDPNMGFSSWGAYHQVPATFQWQNPFMNDINESLDVNTWLPGSGNLAEDTNVAISWKSAHARTPEINGVLDMVETLIPHSSATVNMESGGSAPVHSTTKGKRPRSQQGHDDSNEGESQARKRNAPHVTTAQNRLPQTPLARPHRIPWEVRDLTDEDFEYSCEWCPFFIHQPFKYDSKPWNSCSKQRAESSHIVTHIVADHGIIRGHNTKRSTQRYLTQCAQNNDEIKGKLECTHCQEVQNWTEEDQYDPRHAGKSVCLRCYEELPNKKALFNHLQERSICLYREDLPMRRKSRILYSAFCSSSDVPRFRPPPETAAPRDGARKRNMKSNNQPRSTNKTATQNHAQIHAAQSVISPSPRSNTQTVRQAPRQRQQLQQQPQPQQPAQQPIQPPSTQQPLWSPSALSSGSISQTVVKSEYAGDFSGNYYPQTRNQPQPQPQPPRRSPFTHPIRHTPATVPPLLIPRQAPPSIYSDYDNSPNFNNHFAPPLQLAQSDLGATPVTAQPQQHSPSMQVSGPFIAKHQIYPANDSGYGSQNGGDPSQPIFDDYQYPQTYLPIDEHTFLFGR